MANISQTHFGEGDNVAGDKNVSNVYQSQDLAQAAKDIQSLLDQLSTQYPDENSALVGVRAVTEVESNPMLKERLIKAVKAGGTTAIEKLVDHPAVSIVMSAVKAALE